MYKPIHIRQGIKYFFSSTSQKIKGNKKYFGSADNICKQIVSDCWNGSFFQTSTHHYKNEFWSRDFGLAVNSLLKIGYKKEVLKTLEFALKQYAKANKITTTVLKNTVFSFPNVYSPDSLALFLHSLNSAKAEDIINNYKNFLQKKITEFSETVLDDSGCVKKNIQFSCMRDYIIYNASCYDQCMSIITARYSQKLGFTFPFTEKELIKNLNKNYWTGNLYKADTTTNQPSGDSILMPFWTRVCKKPLKVLKFIDKSDFVKPLPLSYGNSGTHSLFFKFFVKGWQSSETIWPMLGLPLLESIKKINQSFTKKHKKQYKQIIEKYKTLHELYTKDSTPYKSLFYHADEGLIWSAIYTQL